MGSGERKRCSNMAPVRRLRSLAWMKARRFPGVRCSTLNTECRSLLCLMIMPGRSWVAGMDIAQYFSLNCGDCQMEGRSPQVPPGTRTEALILNGLGSMWEMGSSLATVTSKIRNGSPEQTAKIRGVESKLDEREKLCVLANMKLRKVAASARQSL